MQSNRIEISLLKNLFLTAERAFEIRFLPQLCRGKKNSIRTSVRLGGIAAKPCAQGGCSAVKSQRDFFDGLTSIMMYYSFGVLYE